MKVMTEDRTLKVGELLVIETGDESGQEWHGPVRILREFSTHEVAEIFRGVPSKERYFKSDQPDPYAFLPWLVKEGYVEDVACLSWDIGSYTDFKPMAVKIKERW